MFWNKKKQKPEKIQEYVCIEDSEIEKGDPQRIIDPLWWSVSIYDGEERYNSDLQIFSLPQRYIFAIQWYVAEVNNGGHDQFYFNSTGIVWQDALIGFQEIGHKQAYDILKASVDRLGGYPSMDRYERQEQLDNSNTSFEDLDSEFYKITDLDELIMKYIRSHKKDFFFNGQIEKPNL